MEEKKGYKSTELNLSFCLFYITLHLRFYAAQCYNIYTQTIYLFILIFSSIFNSVFYFKKDKFLNIYKIKI